MLAGVALAVAVAAAALSPPGQAVVNAVRRTHRDLARCAGALPAARAGPRCS